MLDKVHSQSSYGSDESNDFDARDILAKLAEGKGHSALPNLTLSMLLHLSVCTIPLRPPSLAVVNTLVVRVGFVSIIFRKAIEASSKHNFALSFHLCVVRLSIFQENFP